MNRYNQQWILDNSTLKKSTGILSGNVENSQADIIKVRFKDMQPGRRLEGVDNFRYFLTESFDEVIRITSSEDTFLLANNPNKEPSITDDQIGDRTFKPFWFNHPNCFSDRFKLLTYSCSKIPSEGVVCEFGVRYGITLQHIVDVTQESRQYYGFDSFEGMPKSKYITRYRKGTLLTGKKRMPKFNCKSVHIIKGWFNDTLKSDEKYFDKIAFIHLDADIYESTKTALEYCHPYFQEGTIAQFDEIHGVKSNTRMHEFKAFSEYIKKYNVEYEILGIVKHGPTSFRLTKLK